VSGDERVRIVVPKSVRRLFRTSVRGSTKWAAVAASHRPPVPLALRAKLDPAFRRAHPEIEPLPTKAQLRAEENARRETARDEACGEP
jgi:hypothetical protein